VGFDHVASRIVNADNSIMRTIWGSAKTSESSVDAFASDLGLTYGPKNTTRCHEVRELRRKRGEPQMTGKTGEKCVSGGSYHCQQHTAKHISIKAGEIFPKCDFGGAATHNTTWVKDETT